MKPIKKIAVLHSLCGVGKASLTNMIPILSVMGVEVCPVPTIMLSTHTGGYGAPAVQRINGEYIRNSADHYRENQVTFDAVFIGYLGNEEMVSSVQYFIKQFPEAVIILDPIMGDHGAFYPNLGVTYAKSFQILLPYADIVLPNLTEASFLTNVPYSEQPDLAKISAACEELKHAGAKQVIITSVPTKCSSKGIVLSENNSIETLALPEVAGEFHGAGDVFDAVFTGASLQGQPLRECIKRAHAFVCECILDSNKCNYPEREGLAIERKLSMLV